MTLPLKKPCTNATSMRKGQTLNPNGRPKGAVSLSTKLILELKERALTNDLEKVYNVLLKQVLAEDPKAIDIWFKLFGTLPNRYKYEMLQLEGLKDKTISTQDKLKKIEETLMDCSDYTFNELLDMFKVVSNHKLGETIIENENNRKLTLEETKEQLRLIEEIESVIEKREKENE